MTAPHPDVGAYVLGAPTSPRALVRHAELLAAYADGDIDDSREAYLSHYAYGAEMQAHYASHRRSVAGYTGPCWCRWLVLDIDRADLGAALTDARRLVAVIADRYGQSIGQLPVYFSGSKGFHALIDLPESLIPSAGFASAAKTFAMALADVAGVSIDPSIYDVAHLIRLPNTRHPRTGLFKRRIDADALLRLDVAGILDLARHPAGDGIGSAWGPSGQLADDWRDAERQTAGAASARAEHRALAAGTPDARAPRYLLDLLRFGAAEGERHQMLFRAAAWLAEQGAPPSLCHALLTEPGCDIGLSPRDVERQIRCGIDHARRQRGAAPDADDAAERWAIQHEGDPLPPGALDFEFGTLAPAAGEGGPS